MAAYTALEMQDYLRAVSLRIGRWLVAAAVEVVFFGIGRLLDLPGWLILVLMGVGAIAGTILATTLSGRLFGPEAAEPPRQPRRGRGSGRRGA
jgi:hypothetical protein